MKSSFEGRLIGFLSSLVSDFESAKSVATSIRTVHLKHGAVLRLEKSSGIQTIEIKSGTVWLTGTPANGDLLLRKDARFQAGTDWPYIIQALESAEIALLPLRHS